MGTKKSNKLYAAAAALAVTASAVAPGLSADAATKVTVKSVVNPASISHYGGYANSVKKLSLPKTVKVMLSNKKTENRSVKWGKVAYDAKYVGKYQTITGTVSGTSLKATIKVKLNNYPIDVVEPKLAPVAVGEEVKLPSTITVKYKNGKSIERSIKSFTISKADTSKAGKMKLSYSYKGLNLEIKGSIAYEVKAAEITNVMNEVKDDMLSVSADVKYPAKGAKAEVLVYPGKDVSKAIPFAAEIKDGKLMAKTTALPVGSHSFAVKVGDVVSSATDFVVEAPMVKEVKAINATQVEVTFNKAVDKTVAENEGNYAINEYTPSEALLSEDGKVATLTFSAANKVEVTDGVVVVQPIQLASDADKSTAKFTKVLTFEDTVKPEIVSVEAKTSGSTASELTVTASEPIESSLAKVNGNYYTVTFVGKVGTITGLSLEANKSHTIELINLTDKGGNVTVQTSKSFNLSVDAAAPTVSLAPQGDNDIVLTFNKPMNVSTVVSALTSDSVKDELLNTVGYTGPVTAVAGSNDTKFVIDVTASLYANQNSRTLSVVLPGTMKDKLGNSFVAGTKTVTLSKDAVKPVATDFKIVKNSDGQVTKLEVYFSEELKANASTALPTIVNENGVAVDVANFLGGLSADAVVKGDKKVVYTAATPAVISGKYAFSFGSDLVSDLAFTANTSASFNHTFDFGKLNAGTFSLLQANVTAPAKNQIRVNFVSSVKGGAVANSATDLSNYTLGGKPLPADTKITLDSDQKIATIVLPEETFAKTDDATVITVSNVEALNGNKLNSFKGTVKTFDNVKPVLSSAVLNSDDTLTIGFSEELNLVPLQTNFVVTINNVEVPLEGTVSAGVGLNAGKYVVTSTSIDRDASGMFFDANKDNDRDAGEVAISSLKFSTASTTVATDTALPANLLKASTTITVK